MSANPSVLSVKRLRTEFLSSDKTWFPVVNDVDLEVAQGETLAVVGESGCGKSMLAHSILRLLPRKLSRVAGGRVMLGDRNLTKLSDEDMRQVRGNDISMVFQEPMTSLNPLMTVGDQIAESILEHEDVSVAHANRRSVELMDLVGISEPAVRAHHYPFQLSGGLRQRIVIAIALACKPKVLIADEPTTALDVTIQAQVLRLIDDLKSEIGMGVILITHDLGVVAEWAQRVMIMYAGRKVEEADAETFFQAPAHPYSRALLGSVPRPDAQIDSGDFPPLVEISGTVPPLNKLGPGCAFADRCVRRTAGCALAVPDFVQIEPGRGVACINMGELS